MITVLLNVIATFFYINALYYAPVYMVVPLTALNPVLVTFSGMLIAGDRPTAGGLAGILLVTAGLILIYFQAISKALEDLKRGKKTPWIKGILSMLVVVACWTFTAPFDKVGIVHSSSVTWAFTAHFGVTAGVTLVIILLFRKDVKLSRRSIKWPTMAGVCSALMLINHMEGLALTLVPYLVSIKRLSVVFSVLGAYIWLGERPTVYQWTGVVTATLGAILITLLG